MNQRKKTILIFALALLFLTSVTLSGIFCYGGARKTDFSVKNLAPCLRYPFGTDWMGRNMLARTLTGLSMSIRIGLCTAGISALLALTLGIMSAVLGKKVDAVISFLIDTIMGIPHILLLLLISYAFGKGFKGVVLGVALTHWPSLARVIRGEVMQLKESEYILRPLCGILSHRRGKAGTEQASDCLAPYGCTSVSPVCGGADTDVSPCHPA